MFSDESRFELLHRNNSSDIRRHTHDKRRLKQSQTRTNQSGDLGIWSCLRHDGLSNLILYKDKMISSKYEILDANLSSIFN